MPKDVKAEIKLKVTVARGFNYIPKGETAERRVDAGTQLPQDLTSTQVARLIERGVVTIQQPVKRVTRSETDG